MPACSNVSRSEFCDLIGVLEGAGLLTSSSTTLLSMSVNSTPSERRGFGRSASFAAGNAPGVWAEEVLRGLGITSERTKAPTDVREEELACLWEREKVRLNRDVKTIALAFAPKDVLGFEDSIAGGDEFD